MFTDSLTFESTLFLVLGLIGVLIISGYSTNKEKIGGIILASISIVFLYTISVLKTEHTDSSIKPGDVLIFDYRATSQAEVNPFRGDTIKILKISNNHALFKSNMDETLDRIDEILEDSTSAKEEHFTSCLISELSTCSIHIDKK